MILEIGPEAVESKVLDLAEQTRNLLREFGAEVNAEASPITAARIPGIEVSQLARTLQAKGILVAARRGNLRVSPHFYNNEADLSELKLALDGLLRA